MPSGSPTINRDALKPVWDVLTSISTYIVKGKPAVVFGSFGWSGEAIKYLSERLRDVGADVLGSSSSRLYPDEKELAEAEKLGKTICEALEKQRKIKRTVAESIHGRSFYTDFTPAWLSFT